MSETTIQKLDDVIIGAMRSGLNPLQIKGQLNRVEFNLENAQKASDAGNLAEMARFHNNAKTMLIDLANGFCDEDAEDWA